MRHGFKKQRFANGQDADQMLFRKLMVNFILNGKIASTFSKIKVLKPRVEKLISKVKNGNEADKNYLLKKLGGEWSRTEKILKDVSSQLKTVPGGYTRISKLGDRSSDGALMAVLSWAHKVVLPEKTKKPDKKLSETKETKK